MSAIAEPSQVESPFLVAAEVAERYRLSRSSLAELMRLAAIPFSQRVPGAKCLFRLADLERWEAGAELETVALPAGGRLVRPRE